MSTTLPQLSQRLIIMRVPKLAVRLVVLMAGLASSVRAQAPRHPMSTPEFLARDRVKEPAISPDGKWVVYTVVTTELAANRRRQDLWLMPAAGGEPRRLTNDSLGGRAAKWAPDGKTIAFINSRGGTPQVW